MRSSLLWDVTQRKLVVSYRRFGTNSLSHPQGSGSPRHLEMGPMGCPETLVTSNKSTLSNVPEERKSQLFIIFQWYTSLWGLFYNTVSRVDGRGVTIHNVWGYLYRKLYIDRSWVFILLILVPCQKWTVGLSVSIGKVRNVILRINIICSLVSRLFHSSPIKSSLVWSPEYYSVSSTNHEAPHYVILSSLLLRLPF
jgi:hypothetical protein